MARYVVDGLTLPVAIGGHPAVDLCNTVTDATGPAPYEYFRSYEHVAVWAREVGLVDAADCRRALRVATDRPAVAADVLDRIVRLRAAVRRVLLQAAEASDWPTIDREIGASTGALRLDAAVAGRTEATEAGPTIATWSIRASEPVTTPLATAAWSAAGLLATVRAGDVRACPGTGCGWLFLDPAHRRRWCSMAWCGNRAKARRHAQRRRTEVV